MAPNKEWMELFNDRLNEKYKIGVEQFLNYAFRKTGDESTIRCPCIQCNNTNSGSREEVRLHLFVNGIMQNYITWYHHGERYGESDDEDSDISNQHEGIEEIIKDLYPDMVDFDRGVFERGSSSHNDYKEEPNDEAKAFYRLLKDSEQPAYPGCVSSKLYVLVNLLHIKSIGRWSNESFDMLLQLLKQILPIGSTLPHTYYDAKKVIKDLGLSYKRIDACVNDCMLYWKEEKECNLCKICGASRWKKDRRNGETKVRDNGKNVAMKTLRYFPLKQRLQRLFMSKKTAIDMRWHHEKRVDDGVMRHPADSKAWKSFNDLYKNFSAEPRNIRLGLASDGFQPFTHSKTSYSIWPVILIPYNLPPWICMKESNFILSMLIPGPDSPGDAIDVYLKPLIEELKELWEEGIETFDASTQNNFKLKASLLWTINDFPAYGNLSGWSTKGKMACPCCNKDTCSMRLVNGKKQCYMGHRRYLPRNHKWRNDKDSFDGTKEVRAPPVSLSGLDVLSQVSDLDRVILTKDVKMKVKITHAERGDNWNKKSVFFDLPYWSSLLLRHNLDVMHIEKNICDNILGTIMNMQGKTKDTVQTRLDLEAMNIRSELHPIRKGEKLHLPAASYTLSKGEKHLFCLFFQQLRVPDGYSSNISQSVNMKEHKISGLKSHDCHVLLQHLLPLAIRGLLPKIVCEALIELSLFFTSLGAKTLNVHELDKIDSQIPITLCKLEQIFPPSFFDVMVHLPVHLANEAKIAGPVHYRWMYPIERMLHGLKQLIRNMARPEGSIAEGYIANECMTLCSRYLKGIKTKFNTLERNHDGGFQKNESNISIFSLCGRPLGGGTTRNLNNDEWQMAHIYILKNCDEVQPFLEEYIQTHQSTTTQVSNEEWNKNFITWFKNKMKSIFAKMSKGSTQRPARFIAPGELAKGCGYGQKVSKTLGECGGFATKSSHGSNIDHLEEQGTRYVSNRRISGGVSALTLTMHFGGDKFKDDEFSEDSSFLDILNMCRKFIDIYSVGFTVTDGDGRELRNDKDVLNMIHEHEGLDNIDIYLEVNNAVKPLQFKLPQDVSGIATVTSVPKVRDCRIIGEYKNNAKVRAHGDVVNGFEHASTIQWFITDSKHFSSEDDLKAISECTTTKEFIIPIEAVGHFLAVKFIPKSHDGNIGETKCVVTDKLVEDSGPLEPRNVRGRNKNKKIAALKASEKLEIQFYNNRAVGKNHSYWSRHLGKVVRDKNICPIRVKSWKDIPESSRQHMWDSVKECFFSSNIELFREHTLDHMGALWTAWRSSLNVKYVKSCKTKAEVLKKVPQEMDAKDWEWLVSNKFLSEEFQKISDRNSSNRVNGVMPHRTGSKPHRQMIFEKTCENEAPLDVAQLFYETRQRNGKLEPQAQKKYDEIVEIVKSNPSLSQIEVVEQSFGPQCHSHIFGFGGGVKRKDFNDSQAAYIKELEAKLSEKNEELREKDAENHKLRSRFDAFESRLARIEDTQQNEDIISTPNT